MEHVENGESLMAASRANEPESSVSDTPVIAGSASEEPQLSVKSAPGLLAEGKRHLLCRNYQEAATSLDMACELYSKQFGEMAYECAEPYFYYGKSLVELEHVNQAVISMGGKDDDETDEEDNDSDNADDEEPDQKAEHNNVEGQSKVGARASDGTSEAEQRVQAPTVTVEKIEDVADSDAAQETDQPSSSKGVCAEEDGDDKSDSVACAWEMLDLARIIYEKHLNALNPKDVDYDEQRKADSLRLAEVRMTLGELCALDEKYGDALDEFKEAQVLLSSFCAPDDRRLAEICFQMGSVSQLDNKFDVAAKSMNESAEILKLRKRNLVASIKTTGVEDAEAMKSEVADLDDVLLDVNNRLEDIIESERSYLKIRDGLKELTTQKIQSSAETVGENSSSAQATDISHLVRKPLKHSTDTKEEPEPKRVKVNGISEAEQRTENGHVAEKTDQN